MIEIMYATIFICWFIFSVIEYKRQEKEIKKYKNTITPELADKLLSIENGNIAAVNDEYFNQIEKDVILELWRVEGFIKN